MAKAPLASSVEKVRGCRVKSRVQFVMKGPQVSGFGLFVLEFPHVARGRRALAEPKDWITRRRTLAPGAARLTLTTPWSVWPG